MVLRDETSSYSWNRMNPFGNWIRDWRENTELLSRVVIRKPEHADLHLFMIGMSHITNLKLTFISWGFLLLRCKSIKRSKGGMLKKKRKDIKYFLK